MNKFSNNLKLPNKNYIFLLGVVTVFFIVGPNINLFGFELFYFVFYFSTFIIITLLAIFGKQKIYIPFIYLVPFLCVFCSLFFKIMFGFEYAIVDFLYLLRYLNLLLAFILVYLVAQKFNIEQLQSMYKKYMYYFVFSLFFISLIGVLQYFNSSLINNPIFRLLYEYNIEDEYGIFNNFEHAERLNRISSIYIGAIQYSSYLVFLSLIVLNHSFNKKKKLLGYLVVISLALIFLANSRASIAAAGLTMFLFLFYRKREKVFFIFLSTITFFLIVSISFNVTGFIKKNEKLGRIFEVFDMLDKGKIEGTGVDRLEDVRVILNYQLNSNYSLTGIPRGVYEKKFPFNSPGNQYLVWYFQYGIFGVFLSLWLLYMPIYYFKKFKKYRKFDKLNLNLLLMCLFLANNVLSISQVYGLATRWKEILFFLMACTYLYNKQMIIKFNEHRQIK